MSLADFGPAFIKFLGTILAYGGGSAAVAYLLFQFLGSRWIESKFAERLEAFRHSQARELEHIRFQIDAQFDRLRKLYDREFEILPRAWGKLNDAYQAIGRCVIAFREFPNLDRMNPDELEEFLSETSLKESEKKRIKESTQKVRTYSEMMAWVEISEAYKAFTDFHSYLVANRIFLYSNLKKKFDGIDDLMWRTWVSYKVGKQANDHRMQYEQFQKNDPEIKRLMLEIEALVQGRLTPTEPL